MWGRKMVKRFVSGHLNFYTIVGIVCWRYIPVTSSGWCYIRGYVQFVHLPVCLSVCQSVRPFIKPLLSPQCMDIGRMLQGPHDIDDILKVIGSKVKGSNGHGNLVNSMQLLNGRREWIWTKTYTHTYYSRETNWLRVQGHGSRDQGHRQ